MLALASPALGEAPEVDPDSPSRSGSTSGSGASSDTAKPATPAKAAEQSDLAESTPESVRAQAPSPQGGGNVLVPIAAGADVLLLGGLAGLLRRRRSVGG